ncbi:MAG: hypothetical protein Q9165_008707 [Trypethelium subeluteriae]
MGVFQDALNQVINDAASTNAQQAQEWSSYLQRSIASSGAAGFVNVTADVAEPLDRLSIGRSLITEQLQSPNASTLAEIKALEQSVVQQPRNANAGLWYYDNVNNLTAYSNLSYLDGMFSYAPFTMLLPSVLPNLTVDAAFDQAHLQLDLLYHCCFQNETGLLVHGYDAIRSHPWANPVNGASPIVWSRSLGWYTVGLVDLLEIAVRSYSQDQTKDGSSLYLLRQRFNELAKAQIAAVSASANTTGRAALWQVVTQPGAQGNFVESSGTALVAYALAKGAQTGLLDNAAKESAALVATKMVEDLVENFVIENENGTLSFNGTSSVASLSGNKIDFEESTAGWRTFGNEI